MPAEITTDRNSCDDLRSRSAQTLPPPGSLVQARGERWQLDASITHGDCAEVHLSNAASGSVVLLWPFDRIEAVRREGRLGAVRPRRWTTAMAQHIADVRIGGLRVGCVSARILPYQLAPALAVANGELRLILADEVGLGKTIQAGWIVADAVARRPDARILIAVPAGLRDQWASELSTHFGLDPVVGDARWLRRAFADLPADVNPWSLAGIYLTSLDFIKRADALCTLDHQTWDVLVVDEVHTAAAPTDRHRALRTVARRSRCVVVLSATPFTGDPRGFDSIVQLGAAPDSPPPLLFRRSREQVGLSTGRRHHFVPVRISRAERELQRQMERYSREVWRETSGNADAARLAMTVLRKRALSSPWAAVRSLERRVELLAGRDEGPRQLRLFDEDTVGDEEPIEALATPGLDDREREQRWLALLIERARQALTTDSKLLFLKRLLRRIGLQNPRPLSTRITRTTASAAIVFTEYRDTLVHLAASFPGAILLHGGMLPAERTDAQRGFNTDGGLLLATDAASEGLNLQGRCRLVVNFELPWNPARLEQRIGRVDRIGQTRTVHALTLVARDTAEDLVIARLVQRLQRIASTLGQRDRLASFLDEARTARIVIGHTTAEEPAPISPSTLVTRTPPDNGASGEEACRLSALQHIAKRPAARDEGLLVSTIRHGPHLAEGFVFIMRTTAATADGSVIDTEPLLFHAPHPIGGARLTAASARQLAAGAIEMFGPALRTIAAARSARALPLRSARHRDIASRLIEREKALIRFGDAGRLIQPGLFDNRALRQAADAATAAADIITEHRRRLEQLERSLTLETASEVVGVLIVRGDSRQ